MQHEGVASVETTSVMRWSPTSSPAAVGRLRGAAAARPGWHRRTRSPSLTSVPELNHEGQVEMPNINARTAAQVVAKNRATTDVGYSALNSCAAGVGRMASEQKDRGFPGATASFLTVNVKEHIPKGDVSQWRGSDAVRPRRRRLAGLTRPPNALDERYRELPDGVSSAGGSEEQTCRWSKRTRQLAPQWCRVYQ